MDPKLMHDGRMVAADLTANGGCLARIYLVFWMVCLNVLLSEAGMYPAGLCHLFRLV